MERQGNFYNSKTLYFLAFCSAYLMVLLLFTVHFFQGRISTCLQLSQLLQITLLLLVINILTWRVVKCTDTGSPFHYLHSAVRLPSSLLSPELQGAENVLPTWILSIFLANYFSVACTYICCHSRHLEVPICDCVTGDRKMTANENTEARRVGVRVPDV